MEFDLCDYDRFALYDPAFYGIKDLISDEDFILFHTIDRKLFSMLICKLGRNVDESMHVVAFLIWLEKIRYSHNAVFKVIAWPLHLVYQLANEVAAFLMCLKNTDLGKEYINLSLLRKLCSRHINLVQFHEKRITILESVNKIVAEDCMRAFKDIVTSNVEFSDMEGDQMWYACSNSVCVPPPYLPNVVGTGYFPQLEFCRNSGSINSIQPSYQLENILEDPNADLSEFFGGMQLVNSFKDESDVAPDDRTIFLTFSKGYYIPELEIREFFTRIFGEFIEGIYMQEVTSDKQPLFARMVCRSSAIIPRIAPPGKKSKYSINGKHIWAKKYVKKSSGSTSQSDIN